MGEGRVASLFEQDIEFAKNNILNIFMQRVKRFIWPIPVTCFQSSSQNRKYEFHKHSKQQVSSKLQMASFSQCISISNTCGNST